MFKHALVVGLLAIACLFTGCSGCHRQAPETPEVKKDPDKPDYSGITVDRVLKTDLKPGTGKVVAEGSTVLVKYEGWIYDPAKLANRGPQFGASKDGTFKFTLGKGEVVRGWELGMLEMKEHGSRRLIIPIALAYGEAGAQNVPPNSILLIEVELVKVL